MTNMHEQRQAWMESHLEWAARTFGVQPVSSPVHTARLHSVGCRVCDTTGGDAWLRVVYADPEWGQGNYLDGNLTANTINNVPKPQVAQWKEWDDNGRQIRGEISTYIPDTAISAGMTLPAGFAPSDQWLAELTRALRALSAHPVPAGGLDADSVNNGIRAFFGAELDIMAVPWTSAHCDLHWGNLTAPRLFLLDWETWGRAPAGYDAATLLCATLNQPETAHRIREALAEFLDTPAGRVATLTAAVRFLRFADDGDHTQLAIPVRRHGLAMLEQLGMSPTGAALGSEG
ncbi:hypothetical protein ACFV9C_43915 [Kribbella sp. NPDC059898]|uniref:hypothetical protein n=1 Tax=Kribbella sp. NPDC059898 TaxID=3346995 RepID=UPI0036662A6E